MLDQMAHRYGMLPSEILAKGTTQDLFVFDVYTTYQNHINEKQRRKAKAEPAIPKAASTDLVERYERFKKRHESKDQ
jgi:hypothetical protein